MGVQVTRAYPVDPPTSCEGCRYWSELIARVTYGHFTSAVEAMCLSAESEHAGQYAYGGCGMYEAGKPVDRP